MSKKNNLAEGKEAESQALPLAILAVAVFGVLLTIVIELSHRPDYGWIMDLCGGMQSGCADVASTPFARVDVPGTGKSLSVAYLGLLAYVFFIFFQVYYSRLLLPMASAMMGAELYFLWVMYAVLGIFCFFCLIQFVTVTILFALTMAWGWKAKDHILPGGALANIGVLALAFIIPSAPVMLKSSPAPVAVSGYMTYAGNPDSDIRVEVYSDYQCPFCKKIKPEIQKIVDNRPDVLVVYRDYIIPSHKYSPFAVSLANALAFTKGKDEFLKFQSELFDNQENLREFLDKNKDIVQFTPELRKKIEDKVAGDLKMAQSLNIYSTPTVVIYKGGKVAQIIKTMTTYEKIERFLN